MFDARDRASEFGSDYIETEHLLLGLIRTDRALALAVLKSENAVNAVVQELEARPRSARTRTSVDLPLSHPSKRALVYGAEAANDLRSHAIHTSHLLSGLLREANSVAAIVLRRHGVRWKDLHAKQDVPGGPPDPPA